MAAFASKSCVTMATAVALVLQVGVRSAAGEPQRVGTVTAVTKPGEKAPRSMEERLAALEKRVDD